MDQTAPLPNIRVTANKYGCRHNARTDAGRGPVHAERLGAGPRATVR